MISQLLVSLGPERGDTLAEWVEAYRIESDSVDSCGLTCPPDLLAEMAPEVQALLDDEEGVDFARAALFDLPETEFESDRLEQILTSAAVSNPEWKVGEALAEHVLVADHDCEFPWPHSRSQRNPHSSDGGADLVGFHHINGSPRFAIGEIKTSCQKRTPPDVLTSRHGLSAQLDGLANAGDRASWAVRYLAMQAVGRPWVTRFRASMKRYLTDPKDVSVFGALIRTTTEDSKDLEKVTKKSEELAEGTLTVSLRAFYVGENGLTTLAGSNVEIETAGV